MCILVCCVLLVVFCCSTVYRVADVRLSLARASLRLDLHAASDVGAFFRIPARDVSLIKLDH